MISSAGNEAVLLTAINQGLVMPYFSQEILEEYSDVLFRPRFEFPTEVVDALLDLFRHRGKLLNPVPLDGVSSDRMDARFIAGALAGKVEFLIPGTKRHSPQILRVASRS